MPKKFIITAREDVPVRTRKKSKATDLYDEIVEALQDPGAAVKVPLSELPGKSPENKRASLSSRLRVRLGLAVLSTRLDHEAEAVWVWISSSP